MKTQPVSNQNFTGKVQIISEFPSKRDRRAINKVWSDLNKLVQNQNFDLYIGKTRLGETVVSTDKIHGYPVLNRDYLLSASLAVRDELNGSYLQRKIKAIKEAIEKGL